MNSRADRSAALLVDALRAWRRAEGDGRDDMDAGTIFNSDWVVDDELDDMIGAAAAAYGMSAERLWTVLDRNGVVHDPARNVAFLPAELIALLWSSLSGRPGWRERVRRFTVAEVATMIEADLAASRGLARRVEGA